MEENHRTKIGVTIGPACSSFLILQKMFREGVDFVRLNFSHGTYEEHSHFIRMIRTLEKETHGYVPVLQDLQGPKIRLGILPEQGIEVKKGEQLLIDTSIDVFFVGKAIPLPLSSLVDVVKVGHRLLIDDGKVEVRVVGKKGSIIKVKVVEGGILFSHKGVNVPDTHLVIPALSSKDKADALFGVDEGVDIICLSFVRSAKDIDSLRKYIAKHRKKTSTHIKIFAKIERPEAIDKLEEIILASDGIMVARGDLGLEMPAEELPVLQKKIISQARKFNRPVIVATQLLDSMSHNKRPTRAEVNDIANCVIDHTDSLLLTNETASGKYPVEAVTMLRKVIEVTEKSDYDDISLPSCREEGHTLISSVLVDIALLIKEQFDIICVAVFDPRGDIVPLLSNIHPELIILAGVSDVRSARYLTMWWGVKTYITSLSEFSAKKIFLHTAQSFLLRHRFAKKGDKVLALHFIPNKNSIKTSFDFIKLN